MILWNQLYCQVIIYLNIVLFSYFFFYNFPVNISLICNFIDATTFIIKQYYDIVIINID